MKILSWAEEDRPREKLLLKGKSALSDAEHIAILLGSGTQSMTAVDVAKHILSSVDNDLNELARLNVKELQKFKGIGEAKAISIVSALELGRRRKNQESPKKVKITSSREVYETIKPELLDLQIEEFWILHLNRANQVMKKEKISLGGVAGTVVDPKVVFKTAIQNLSSAIVLIHNHPSGNIKPSKNDIDLTKKFVSCGQLLEIPVLDHIIFANDSFYSFADEGHI